MHDYLLSRLLRANITMRIEACVTSPGYKSVHAEHYTVTTLSRSILWAYYDNVCCRELPVTRQVSLLETLAAAASQMAPTDKLRPGAGPPPLLFLQHALAPAEHLKPQHLNLFLAKTPAESVIGESGSAFVIPDTIIQSFSNLMVSLTSPHAGPIAHLA